jgi:hypothetical protein
MIVHPAGLSGEQTEAQAAATEIVARRHPQSESLKGF